MILRDCADLECYARELGGCSAKMSREHFISKSVLDVISEGKPFLYASGLMSMRSREPARRDIKKSLGSKILCEKHNGELRDYDSAAKALFAALNHPSSTPKNSKPTNDTIDGDRFERWMLKVLCGGLFSGEYPVLSLGLKPVRGQRFRGQPPPLAWLQILFDGGSFPRRQGLYVGMWGRPAEEGPGSGELRVQIDTHAVNSDVIGIQMWYFGFPFGLILADRSGDSPTWFSEARYRPARIKAFAKEGRPRIPGAPASMPRNHRLVDAVKDVSIRWADGHAGHEVQIALPLR